MNIRNTEREELELSRWFFENASKFSMHISKEDGCAYEWVGSFLLPAAIISPMVEPKICFIKKKELFPLLVDLKIKIEGLKIVLQHFNNFHASRKSYLDTCEFE